MVEDYEQVQLRRGSSSRSDGTTIMYLAPNAEVRISDSNDIIDNVVPERPTHAYDNGRVATEITIQGDFKHSNDLNSSHASALETLTSKSPVTPSDQENYLRSLTTWRGVMGKFVDLYTTGKEFRLSGSDIDGLSVDLYEKIQDGVYPHGVIKDVKTKDISGENRIGYTIKIEIGIE